MMIVLMIVTEKTLFYYLHWYKVHGFLTKFLSVYQTGLYSLNINNDPCQISGNAYIEKRHRIITNIRANVDEHKKQINLSLKH